MTFADTLRENKLVYTVAGAGDLAVEKLREAPEHVGKARETAAKYQVEVRQNLGRYSGEVRGNLDKYGEQVRDAVAKYRGGVRENVDKYRGEARQNVGRLQEKVEVKDLPGAAVAYVTHFGTRAVEFVDELAERGKKVVHGAAAEVAKSAEGVAEVAAGDQGKGASRAKAARARKAAGEQTGSGASTRGADA
ncbi:hypothetical protein DZF91_26990 [Actinomadura logoneensis]|uniref:Uncharacterized protein n=1 Tax=Actinomadura logoneensis TaxID=2293572 RepID=A0A372JFI9_9ACTN|nr:hypothetical protein [Actinomadura logoneensis]RFU38566.1 hypothetical protein DZF91_26990 [Actinomadura logoneensis]